MRALTKNIRRRTPFGFTLIEIIIAMSLFAIIASLGTTFFIQVSRIYKRVVLQNQLLNEAEFAMERLRHLISQNAIDYEEYYNQSTGGGLYGANYGDYGKLFYDDASGRATGENTGSNPLSTAAQTELYLINGNGDHKIIIAQEYSDTTNTVLAMAEMDGTDTSSDTYGLNGIPETWTCSSSYTCSASDTPNADDLTAVDGTIADDDFIPITPSNITIESLTFYISPLEDPRKAFAEKTADVVIQPHVTIVMTASITDEAALGTYGNTPSVQLETTVSSHVYNDVTSYVSN